MGRRTFKETKADVLAVLREHTRMRPSKLMYKVNLTSDSKEKICDELEAEGLILKEWIDKFHYEYVCVDWIDW